MKKITKITFFIFTSIVTLPVFSLFFYSHKEDSVVFINSASADVPAVVPADVPAVVIPVIPSEPTYLDYFSGSVAASSGCDGAGSGGSSGCDSW